MKDDRSQKLKKQKVYAESVLLNAMRVGGFDEVLRVRNDLANILSASMSIAEVSNMFNKDATELYRNKSKNKNNQDIIRKIFDGASEALLDILCIMSDNNDLYLSFAMYDVYNNLIEKQFNIVIADVVTVVPLNNNLRMIIKSKLKKDFNSEIVLHEHIDKKIIGGITITAKNRILDCSMLTLLEKTKAELTSVHNCG